MAERLGDRNGDLASRCIRTRAVLDRKDFGAFVVIVFEDFIYLFTETHRERGRDTGRGRSRLPAGSLVQDSIPGPQDHVLGQRQALNH